MPHPARRPRGLPRSSADTGHAGELGSLDALELLEQSGKARDATIHAGAMSVVFRTPGELEPHQVDDIWDSPEAADTRSSRATGMPPTGKTAARRVRIPGGEPEVSGAARPGREAAKEGKRGQVTKRMRAAARGALQVAPERRRRDGRGAVP